MILKLKDGEVKIKLFPDIAPNHVKRFKTLADSNQYDGVVFHRVIDGFMAQTGDVQFGNSTNDKYDLARAGTGGSDLPDLKAEFSNLAHEKGILSMARSADPNSSNSQFLIFLGPFATCFINNNKYYNLVEILEEKSNINLLVDEIERISLGTSNE